MQLDLYNHPHFSIENIPFGVFKIDGQNPRVGIAIGEYVLDLGCWSSRFLSPEENTLFNRPSLNRFVSQGKDYTGKVRLNIQDWLVKTEKEIDQYRSFFYSQKEVQMCLPFHIGDYTDFYSSKEHAINVGRMFRGSEKALLPNWLHMPVAYHGRSSSILISGMPIRRPTGQVSPVNNAKPLVKPSEKLDFEIEMGFVVGKDSKHGKRIPIVEAEEYIFGLVMVNDWSARDIQKWEYVPLGPFLGKNFATSISPWVVTMEALKPFRIKGPEQIPKPLKYLQSKGEYHYNIEIDVSIITNGIETTISRTNTKYLYWNIHQQLAHHTINGCNVRVGDLMASGTISGKEKDSYGSMLELSWNGKNPILLNDGSHRSFLHDHDRVVFSGLAVSDEYSIGFGNIDTFIEPPLEI